MENGKYNAISARDVLLNGAETLGYSRCIDHIISE